MQDLAAAIVLAFAATVVTLIPTPRTQEPAFVSPPSDSCGFTTFTVIAPGTPHDAHLVLSNPFCTDHPLSIDPSSTIYNPSRSQTTYLFVIDFCAFCPNHNLTISATIYYKDFPRSTPEICVFNDGSCCE